MRFRHIFSETFAGLRQNLTMTLAVVMTMWVSLSLFGAGLLANQQVEPDEGPLVRQDRDLHLPVHP